MRYFVIFILLISQFSLEARINKKRLLIEKGFANMEMDGKIIPQFLLTKKNVYSLLGNDIPNSFIIFDGNFELMSLIDLEKIEEKGTIPGFPGQNYYSDYHSLLWSKQGRGFYAVDLESKKVEHIIVSHDGDSEIRNTFVINPAKKIFYIEQLTLTETGKGKFFIYDYSNNSIQFTSNRFDGMHFPFTDSSLLWIEFYDQTKVRWHITDLEMQNVKENDLTKKLTELQIIVDDHEINYNTSHRIMFGWSDLSNLVNPDVTPFYLIRWDVAMKDIKTEPIIMQLPNGHNISQMCRISPDGKWLKTTATPKGDGQKISIFYNLNDKYPQGLSLPVFGGNTVLENPGCFVNHTKLGPLYVEMDSDHENVLLIYKLNDCFEILRKKAVGK